MTTTHLEKTSVFTCPESILPSALITSLLRFMLPQLDIILVRFLVTLFFLLFTAQSFIQQTKDSIPWRHEGGPIPKERPQSILGLSFCTFCLLSLCKLGLGVFHLRFSLPLQAADFLLFCYCGLFPLSFSHHHFGLLFAFLPNTSLFF